MTYNGIEFLFTTTDAKKNWNNLDQQFLFLITEFFKSKKVIQVSLNSLFRLNSPGQNNYHGYGQAMDIHTIKYTTGQLVSFNAREDNYSLSEDDFLFREFRSWFGSYKFEYISPANVFTGYEKHNNIYRNYSKEQKTVILNKMENEKLPYEINRTHLHHLHLALNPNRGAKRVTVLKIAMAGIAGLIVSLLVKKKRMYFLKT